MSLLRFASLVILSVWIGGLAVLGFVAAPATFAELDRASAGKLFGEILQRFQHVVWVLGGLLLAILATRAALGPRPRRFWLRLWTIVGMLVLSVVSSFVLAPRIDAIRRSTVGAVAELSSSDPRKRDFDRLHGWSTGLMLLTLAAGMALVWLEAEDKH